MQFCVLFLNFDLYINILILLVIDKLKKKYKIFFISTILR